MINKVLGFLFGKSPDIFDADGNVVHKFTDDKWKKWNARFKSRDYDWHQHIGTERKIPKAQPPPQK